MLSEDGQHMEAVELYEKALPLYEQAWGHDHPLVAQLLLEKALAWSEQIQVIPDKDAALEICHLLTRAEMIHIDAAQDDTRGMQLIYETKADMLVMLDDYEQAQEYRERASELGFDSDSEGPEFPEF